MIIRLEEGLEGYFDLKIILIVILIYQHFIIRKNCLSIVMNHPLYDSQYYLEYSTL